MARSRSRSSITLYSRQACTRCHQVKMVLAVKGVEAQVIEQAPDDPPHEDLLALNPFGTMPTLVDRDLTLFDAEVVSEYLDERYPFPPLWPTDPAARARARLILKCWVGHWRELFETSLTGGKAGKQAARELDEAMRAHADGFKTSAYFMHEEPTLVDCALVPLLWALAQHERLPDNAAIKSFAQRQFGWSAFKQSLRL